MLLLSVALVAIHLQGGVSLSSAAPYQQQGQTITLQQGSGSYSGVTDTRLQQNNATTNYGSAAYFAVKANSAMTSLVRFDLSGLPAGSQIQSASLALYLDNKSASRDFTLMAYPLARSWNERQATWNQAASGQAWAQTGAAAVGGDYMPSPVSTALVRGASRAAVVGESEREFRPGSAR